MIENYQNVKSVDEFAELSNLQVFPHLPVDSKIILENRSSVDIKSESEQKYTMK